MHLVDMLSVRAAPAAGLFLTLTRRCPLACAHCSTNSTLASEEISEAALLRFVDTFTPGDCPQLVLLTGGEPLLRPGLVHQLTTKLHAMGAQVGLVSGLFFARQPSTPPAIDRAIRGVDHFITSLDVYHEAQVSRVDVFRVVRELVDRGQDVSFHVVGMDQDDPYLAEVTSDVRKQFEDRVPMLVAALGAVGRAREWLERRSQHPTSVAPAPLPCSVASWPVVAFDGTVVACCNQAVVDGPAPPHLRLGHVEIDDWTTIRERHMRSTLLRAIRVFGPRYIAHQFGSPEVAPEVGCQGYCERCQHLSEDRDMMVRLDEVFSRPSMQVVEEQVTIMQTQRFNQGIAAYEHLRRLGYAEGEPACAR